MTARAEYGTLKTGDVMLAYKAKLQLNKLQKSLISKTILDCVELYNTTIELASEQTSIPSVL